MSVKYPGGFITNSPVVPSTTSASGIWTLDQVMQYNLEGKWPGEATGLYAFTTATFTPGGSVGTVGPSLVQARTGITGTPAPSGWNTNTSYFNTSSGVMLWTVPATRTYRITCAGAQGGAGKFTSFYGGFGRVMVGTVSLTQGEVLSIIVGQKGGYVTGGAGSAGGGGGSFVFRTSSTRSTANVLVAAGGGGGGGGNSANQNGLTAPNTTTGGSNSSGDAGGSGGSGATTTYSGGGGGGGISSAGAAGANTAAGGLAISGTSNGGRGGNCAASTAGSFNFNSLGADQGGFGGGGGGEWCAVGGVGGGGGYSGGAGNSSGFGVGGGGGSFIGNGATQISNTGTNGVTTLSERAGLDGYVLIEAI